MSRPASLAKDSVGDWNQFRARLERRYLTLSELTKDELVLNLRHAAPVGQGGERAHGAVRDGVRGDVHLIGIGRYLIVVDDPEPAALFTDRGTRPHVIEPRRGRALRFSAGGVTVFAAHVDHPGYKGSHWFRNEVDAAKVRAVLTAMLHRLPA